MVGIEPVGTQFDLSGRLFAGNIEDFFRLLGQIARDLEEQGGFTDTRTAAYQCQ